MRKFPAYILSTLLLSAIASSCNNSGCTENQNSLPLAGFYSMSTQEKIALDSISIGGVNAPDDSLLVNNGKGVSSVYLPFRSSRQSSSFFIHYEQKDLSSPALNDTITFDYTSFPVFVSEECGAMYHYTITNTAYTRHILDSVSVTDPVITNIDMERIKLFFRTAVPNDTTYTGNNEPENTEGNRQEESETTA